MHVARVDRALGVGADHEDVGVLLLQVPRRAGDRPAGPDAGDEHVDLAVGLPPDLGARGRVVRLGVLGVHVLVRLERSGDLLGQAVGDPVVGLGRLGRHGGRADHDLGAVRAGAIFSWLILSGITKMQR